MIVHDRDAVLVLASDVRVGDMIYDPRKWLDGEPRTPRWTPVTGLKRQHGTECSFVIVSSERWRQYHLEDAEVLVALPRSPASRRDDVAAITAVLFLILLTFFV